MAKTKTYVLTANTSGFDQVISGQQLILNGHPQFHADGSPKLVPTGHHKQIIFNANAPNSFGTGDDLEISNLVTNNTINAQEFGTDIVATVLGIQNINVKLLSTDTDGDGDVTLEGGFVTDHNGNVVANYSGLTTVTLTGSAGAELFVGTNTNPLEVLLTNLAAQAATAQHAGIDVRLDAALFTAPVTVNVKLNGVGNPGTHQSDSDDYVHGSSNAFEVAYGASDGSQTATTWTLNVTGKNYVTLFTHGATNTTTINVTGAGSLTLFGESFEFQNLTTINDTATGAQVITGGLQDDGASRPDTGLLDDNGSLTSLTVTSTSAANFIDLSSFSSLSGMTISIGGGTVVLDDFVLMNLSAPLSLGNVTNIGYGGDDGDGPGIGGTINWAMLPTTANTLTFYHGVDSGSFLTVNNAPSAFTVNFQDENFRGNPITISAADTSSLTNSLEVILGSAQTGDNTHGIYGVFTTNGYHDVNIHLAEGTSGEEQFFAVDGFVANPNSGDIPVIHITGGNASFMVFGNVFSVSPADYFGAGFVTSSPLFGEGVTVFGGSIIDTANTFLEIGVTDASSINAAAGHGLDMEDPGSDVGTTFTAVGTSNVWNNLQGTLGFVLGGTNSHGGFFAIGGTSNLTGGSHGDHIWDTGGTETITLVATAHDKIFFSQAEFNSDFADTIAIAITNNSNNSDLSGFNPFGGLTTITGFVPSNTDTGGSFVVSHDFVDFNTSSWGSGGGYLGLVEGDLNSVSGSSHFANVFVLNSSGLTLTAGADLIAIQQGGTFGGAGAAAGSLASATSAVTFASGNSLGSGDSIDMLIAFNVAGGVEIGDAHIYNQTGGAVTSTAGLDITGIAFVKLVGVTLAQVEGASAGSFDVVHYNAL